MGRLWRCIRRCSIADGEENDHTGLDGGGNEDASGESKTWCLTNGPFKEQLCKLAEILRDMESVYKDLAPLSLGGP